MGIGWGHTTCWPVQIRRDKTGTRQFDFRSREAAATESPTFQCGVARPNRNRVPEERRPGSSMIGRCQRGMAATPLGLMGFLGRVTRGSGEAPQPRVLGFNPVGVVDRVRSDGDTPLVCPPRSAGIRHLRSRLVSGVPEGRHPRSSMIKNRQRGIAATPLGLSGRSGWPIPGVAAKRRNPGLWDSTPLGLSIANSVTNPNPITNPMPNPNANPNPSCPAGRRPRQKPA